MRTHALLWLAALLAGTGLRSAAAGPVMIPAATLEDKLRGGLLGQMLGDLNGLKHEMKYIAEPGNVQTYVPELPEGAWTDDDTDIEWVYVLEMQRSKTILLPPPRIVELWRRHVNRRIWCSHLYLRQLMDLGIEPPLTGRVQFNPWADFNLSGQFVNETFGLIAPGMPQTASRIALHYTHVSIDGEPAQSTQLFASMIATAYFTSDIEAILNAGAAATDPRGKIGQIVNDVRRWHKQNPRDWRATRQAIRDRYSYYGGKDVRDRNGVQLNAAATIAALLYGQGDFVETVRHAFNFGWDCDNNAATAGTILGVIKGNRWLLGQGWNIKDVFRNTSRDNMPEDETITRFGDRLVALAGRVITEHGGAKTGSAYRIAVERPRMLEPLGGTQAPNLAPGIEKDLLSGAPQRLARAAYLAICLDLAPGLRARHPQEWSDALAALNGYPKVVQVLFFHSPIPAGERIRERALAAGLQKPAKAEKIW